MIFWSANETNSNGSRTSGSSKKSLCKISFKFSIPDNLEFMSRHPHTNIIDFWNSRIAINAFFSSWTLRVEVRKKKKGLFVIMDVLLYFCTNVAWLMLHLNGLIHFKFWEQNQGKENVGILGANSINLV